MYRTHTHTHTHTLQNVYPEKRRFYQSFWVIVNTAENWYIIDNCMNYNTEKNILKVTSNLSKGKREREKEVTFGMKV